MVMNSVRLLAAGALALAAHAPADDPPKQPAPAQGVPGVSYALYVNRLFQQDEGQQPLFRAPNGQMDWTWRLADGTPGQHPYTFAWTAASPLGLATEPVGDLLRAQLTLPEGAGLVVTALTDDGPAAQAGLKKFDLLLSAGETPLKAPGDLDKALADADDESVTVKLLRGGKEQSIEIKASAVQGPAEYYLGVPVGPIDDASRAQLDLPEGAGLAVVGEVDPETPAGKAGLEKGDVLLQIDGKPIADREDLVARIQASEGKALTLAIRRAGRARTIEATPARRKASQQAQWFRAHGQPPEALRFFGPGVITGPDGKPAQHFTPNGALEHFYRPRLAPIPGTTAPGHGDLEEHLKQIHEHLEALRKAIESKEKPGAKD